MWGCVGHLLNFSLTSHLLSSHLHPVSPPPDLPHRSHLPACILPDLRASCHSLPTHPPAACLAFLLTSHLLPSLHCWLQHRPPSWHPPISRTQTFSLILWPSSPLIHILPHFCPTLPPTSCPSGSTPNNLPQPSPVVLATCQTSEDSPKGFLLIPAAGSWLLLQGPALDSCLSTWFLL